jgi:hypothetical protein
MAYEVQSTTLNPEQQWNITRDGSTSSTDYHKWSKEGHKGMMIRQFHAKSRPTRRVLPSSKKIGAKSRRPTTRLSATSVVLFVTGVLALLGAVVMIGNSSSTDQYALELLQAHIEPAGGTQSVAKVGLTDAVGGAPIKVAYAISLIECTDNHKSGQSSVAGLQDASIILRHSIHQNSVRNPASGSKYDYEMYAIVHEQAKACAPVFEDAGFQIMIKDPPILASEIQGDYLRTNIQKEVCCGAHEFVKLYAYQISAPLVVHLDIDFIFRKPMDAVFDVMLGATDEETRAQVEREDPSAPWPSDIEAMITRQVLYSLGWYWFSFSKNRQPSS